MKKAKKKPERSVKEMYHLNTTKPRRKPFSKDIFGDENMWDEDDYNKTNGGKKK